MFRFIVLAACLCLSSSLYAVQRYQSAVATAEWNVNTSPILCEMIHPIEHYGDGRFVYNAGGELAFQLRALRAPTKEGVASLYSVAPFWREKKETPLAEVTLSTGKMPIYVGGDLALRMLNELEAGHQPTLHYKDWASYTNDVVVSISTVNFHKKYDEFQQCMSDALPYGIDQLKDTVVHFAKNKHSLSKQQLAKLDDIILFASIDKTMQIEVQGHTDSQGRRIYNQKLSQRRASTVEKYLMNQGVSAEQISRKAFGEMKPIDSNRTKHGRAKNRRVNIILDLE